MGILFHQVQFSACGQGFEAAFKNERMVFKDEAKNQNEHQSTQVKGFTQAVNEQ